MKYQRRKSRYRNNKKLVSISPMAATPDSQFSFMLPSAAIQVRVTEPGTTKDNAPDQQNKETVQLQKIDVSKPKSACTTTESLPPLTPIETLTKRSQSRTFSQIIQSRPEKIAKVNSFTTKNFPPVNE